MAELPSYYYDFSDRVKLNAALAVAQLGAAGFNLSMRLVQVQNVSRFVFPFVQNCVAFLVLAPVAYFVEKDRRPDLRFSTICRLFILGSIGVVINQVNYVTSPTYMPASIISAIENLTPAFTFILATSCWLEEVNLRRLDGQAKVAGILVSVSGAVLMSLYQGPAIMRNGILRSVLQPTRGEMSTISVTDPNRDLEMLLPVRSEAWQLGAISLIGSVSLSVYLILQVPILTRYPAPLSVAAFACLFGALELAVLAAMFEHDPSKWAFTSGPQVFTVLYAGFIATGLVVGTQAWGTYRGGPVIVAAYQPLKAVAITLLGLVFLKNAVLHLGSLIGGVLVVSGIGLVVWGREEQRRMAVIAPSEESGSERYWGID
ncbi:hypothetical protein O6H91_09G103800 [Diphasiastrum complanatum]|uniref:Uncharacterized protein n=1 Tax=Diphasiastrum complanatum TaxID=34168 RepID=A0ACC2CSJ1_DIPCM|nr:hypothetical protein O6H91_09G103800 [Diphasiastrum complanatum]